MDFKLNKNRPICPQIGEIISVKIAKEELKPNEKLSSVREVAVTYGVNPNTVQKAYDMLEEQGLIYSVRGTGWFVCDNADKAKEIVGGMIESKTAEYFAEMSALGMDTDSAKEYVKEWNNGRTDEM